MAAWRVSFFYSQRATIHYGWSCNFWNNLTTIAEVITKASQMQDLLKACMGAGSNYDYVRISNPDVPRQVSSDQKDSADTVVVAADNNSDFPVTAALVGLHASDTEYTRQWVRGLKDVDIGEGGRLQKNVGSFSTPFTAWVNHLTAPANGWCIRIMDRTKTEHLITVYDPMTGIFTTSDAHGVVANAVLGYNKVNFRGIKLPKHMNGVKRVKVLSTTTLQTTPFTAPATGTVTTVSIPSAYVRDYVMLLKPITAVYAERSTKHDTGRPTRVGIGRRSTRC